MTFEKFFRKASRTPAHADGFPPYPYQTRLADHDSLPEVLSIPTGVGKTGAVILSWLYRRRCARPESRQSTPCRLIYCLPMRTLVEQTANAADEWLRKLSLDDVENGGIGVHILMGGSDKSDWYEHPERDAILIGTQDMLLSRALNRGYGMSRYQWPMHFALLNNDCLWVLDETQLMGVGVTTSAQMQGFREQLNVYGNVQTVWMSATLDAKMLATVDHPCRGDEWRTEKLDEKDFANPRIQKLINAEKPCRRAETVLTKDNQGDFTPLADEVLQAHKPKQLTLVVVNRVNRAQDLFTAIKKLGDQQEQPPETCLIHSRFRPHERGLTQQQALSEDDLPDGGRIIVATQAIEAGVDLSATTLFTELAPWSSLVQRFGRCNRRGTCGEDGNPRANVVWIDIDTQENTDKNLPLPYTIEELDQARNHISGITDVGPQTLDKVEHNEPPAIVHTIRRKDLIDLFDTTPDLAGNDLDISRYIRDSDDNDVQVYWREWNEKENKGAPPPTKDDDGNVQFPAPSREELCSVSIGALSGKTGFVKKSSDKDRKCFTWNPLDKKWSVVRPEEVRPGMTLLFHTGAGGYREDLGWTGDVKHQLQPCPPPLGDGDAETDMGDDDTTGAGKQLALTQHLTDVAQAAAALKRQLAADGDEIAWPQILTAARWHDVGKAHPAFQAAMRGTNGKLDPDVLWAKSGNDGRLKYQVPDEEKPRRGFRHELASALAWLAHHDGEPHADLVAFLIAAHHGKVRGSIRSLPNESQPKDPTIKFARGLWDRDTIPSVDLGNGETTNEVTVNLSLMELGEYIDADGTPRPSWLARVLKLRDDPDYGPFRLAYLETIVRLADWIGTAKGGEGK